MLKVTSAERATSRGVLPQMSPRSIKGAALAGVRFVPYTSWPVARKRPAIRLPIAPSPTKPILVMHPPVRCCPLRQHVTCHRRVNMASDADRIGPNPALSNLVIRAAERLDDSLLRDDVLAERARLGSATAFAELFRRHRDAVHVIVRNLCRTEAETEEVLREAFLGAWRNFASFPPG